MAIIKKIKHSWKSGRNLSITRTSFKYLIECDNTDCKRQFIRSGKYMNDWIKNGLHNTYCNHACQFSHTVGICLEDNCAEPIYYRQSTHSSDGLCSRHSRLKQGKIRQSIYRERTRDKLYSLLGDKCACCGEKDRLFFQIDHIHNDGAKHREKVNGKNVHRGTSPDQLLGYLKDNPNGLQILCANCNYAKHHNGGELYIPTKWTRRKASPLLIHQ